MGTVIKLSNHFINSTQNFSLVQRRVLFALVQLINKFKITAANHSETLLHTDIDTGATISVATHLVFSIPYKSFVVGENYSYYWRSAVEMIDKTFIVGNDTFPLVVGVRTAGDRIAGKLTLEIHYKALPFFNNVNKYFTLLDIEETTNIQSKYTLRFIELLSQFSDKGIYRKSVTDLRLLLSMPAAYERWDNFKRVIDKMRNELKNTRWAFDYARQINNKVVTSVAFTLLNTKRVNEAKFDNANSVLAHWIGIDGVKLREWFGLSEIQSKVVICSLTPDEIISTLKVIQKCYAAGGIKNAKTKGLGGYTWGTFTKVWGSRLSGAAGVVSGSVAA